jgi:hypothetical protein
MNNRLEIVCGKIPMKTEGYTSVLICHRDLIEVGVGQTSKTSVRFYVFTLDLLGITMFVPFEDVPWSRKEIPTLKESEIYKFVWPKIAKKITLPFLKYALSECKQEGVYEGRCALAEDLKKLLDP